MSSLKNWQKNLGLGGLAVWLVALPASEILDRYNLTTLYKVNSGYVLAFITVFSGYVFWEIVHGRKERFLSKGTWWRPFSYIVVGLVLLFGGFALVAEIFGNTDWRFNLGALLAGIVVSIGFIPFIEHTDKGAGAP